MMDARERRELDAYITREQEVDDNFCTVCDGTGIKYLRCETCAGQGWVDDPSDGGAMTCPKCDAELCAHCDGTCKEPEKPQ